MNNTFVIFFKKYFSLKIPWFAKISIFLFIIDFAVYLFLVFLTFLQVAWPLYWEVYFKSHLPLMSKFVMPKYMDGLSPFDLFLCWLNSALIGFVIGLCADLKDFFKIGK